MSFVEISSKGVFVHENGKPKRKVEPGWQKCWLFENVYGWEWLGPMNGYTFYQGMIGGGTMHLCVLPYEPDREERLAIQERFKDAPTPDGGPLFNYGPKSDGDAVFVEKT